jgi:hypothetical protein
MEMTHRVEQRQSRRFRPCQLAPAAIPILVTLLVVAVSGPAAAQFVFMDSPHGGAERAHDVDIFVDGQFGADIDGGGRMSFVHTGARYATSSGTERALGFGLSGGFLYDGYDFNEIVPAPSNCAGNAACFGAPPWKSIYTIDVAPSGTIAFGPRFQLLTWVPIRFALESGSGQSSVTGGVIGAFRFVLRDGRFATTLGVGYQSELEAKGRVFPVIATDWQFNPRWRLLTEGGPNEGGLVTLLYGPSETIKLRVSTGWERSRFRLSQAGTRHPNGIGLRQDAPILVGMQINLTPSFHFDVHGGLAVGGRVQISDRNGNVLSDENYDVAGRMGLTIRGVF